MNPRINLTAQDKTAAAFAGVTQRVERLGVNLDSRKGSAVSALGALADVERGMDQASRSI